MKTAGVVVDFYDDLSGALLKKAFPTAEEVPEIVKTAHILTPEEREVLRDEAYALVMKNEGTILRKFACVDEGNTMLSVLYFMQHADKLPPEAIKVAAANLAEYCEEYGLPVPEMLKEAKKTGMSKTRDPERQPANSEDKEWAQRTNLVSIQGGADGGRVIPTASQMKTASSGVTLAVGMANAHNFGGREMLKELVMGGDIGTDDKRNIGVKAKMPKLNKPDINLDSFHKLNPEAKPKSKKAGIVDVSGFTHEVTVKRASAERTALGGQFPLDAMADVQKAVEYFQENYKTMEPIEAHIFAVKTASRAEELGIRVSEELSRYGATTYAEDVDAHLANRLAVAEPEFRTLYKEIREKRAEVEPEEFAELLKEADVVSGLKWAYGGEVADPYYATFGKVATSWSWQSRTGDFVSEEELTRLARNGRPLIHKHFSSEVTSAFIKDPIAIFESMPDDSKTILARLAADKFDGLKTN